MPLNATLTVQAVVNLTNALDLVTGEAPMNVKKQYTLTDGNGANQAQAVFSDQRALGGSSNEELDLAGGLTDVYGATITFTKIKAIFVIAAAANGDNIEVGGSVANGFDAWVGAAGDLVKVRPGGVLALIAAEATAYAVTAGTGDLLKIANADAAGATYDIIIVGTTS
jgi:hypothetical protein